jgi:hypothetical protein
MSHHAEHVGRQREKFWQRTIRRQQLSGLTVHAFCPREGLKEGPSRFYSVTGTCKHHAIDTFAYLHDVLRRLPSHPADQFNELLPDVWFASRPSARRKRAG